MLIGYITDSVPFRECGSMKCTIYFKHCLFNAILIAETTKLSASTHRIHVCHINRTMKSEVNKRVNEPYHASNKQTGKMKWFQFKFN